MSVRNIYEMDILLPFADQEKGACSLFDVTKKFLYGFTESFRRKNSGLSEEHLK